MRELMIHELKHEELSLIFGGNDDNKPSKETSLAYDIAYGIGALLKGFWEFCKTASEYQASLPSTYKK